MLWTLLPIIILAAAAGYVVLVVRRARREQRARSDERAAALLLAMHGKPGKPQVETTTVGPITVTEISARVANEAVVDPAPIPEPNPVRRPRFLTDPQRLLYLVLRAALPDHVVMANTRMVDLYDLPASADAVEADPHLRELLHQRLDCVVCRNDLVPLAAMVVYAAAMPPAAHEQTKAESLRALGIKFLRFRADSLPRPAEMRALVLG
jgi:hypothetical protein